MRYETPDEFFKRSPGKTIADYYQLRKKIQSGPSKNKPIINKAEEASKADFGLVGDNHSNKEGLSGSAKMQIVVSSIGIICFFVPWLHGRNSLFPDHGLSYTGYGLFEEGNNLQLLIFPLVFLVNALLITYRRSELLFLRNIVLAIPLVSLIVGLYQIIDMAGGIENVASAVSMISDYFSISGVSISFGIGSYGTLICYLLLPLLSSGLKDS